MLIKGLQKLTLLDYPEKTACTVFMGGCNFRCPFCHNASLVVGNDGENISEEEFFSFLEKRKNVLQGVCVTGGEPTLMPDLEDFLRRIKEKGYLIKLDTNGYKPDVIKKLVGENLVDYIAMDIKNSEAKYALTAGIPNLNIDVIKESISFIISCGIEYEFRTTIVREYHTPQDMVEIAELIKGAKKYFLQPFVDSGNILGCGCTEYNNDEMKKLEEVTKKAIPCACLRGC